MFREQPPRQGKSFGSGVSIWQVGRPLLKMFTSVDISLGVLVLHELNPKRISENTALILSKRAWNSLPVAAMREGAWYCQGLPPF